MRAAGALVVLLLSFSGAAAPRKTKNVILVMSDGLRWQEVFSGAEAALMTKEEGVVEGDSAVRSSAGQTPAQRRAALLPFLWSELVPRGQLYGNRGLGSVARVTNTQWFSYPGYAETLVGFADPRITSNDKHPNPNATVFEWLNGRPGFSGRISGFAAWDVMPFIFNTARAGFVINDSTTPITHGKLSPLFEHFNRLRLDTPRRWGEEHFDSLVADPALEWLKENKPRLFFLGLGETDEWAHEGEYAEYLRSARRVDGYLERLWKWVQSTPEYKDQTTLIVTCDHGRGSGPEWRNHGAKVSGSDATWMLVVGPDTPPLGERRDTEPVTQAQLAATIAALLGEDYVAAVPQAAKPIGEAIVVR